MNQSFLTLKRGVNKSKGGDVVKRKVMFYLNEKFRDYMELKKWSSQDLARIVGCTEPQVSAILNQKIEPSMQFLHKLCAKTSLNLEDIVVTEEVE